MFFHNLPLFSVYLDYVMNECKLKVEISNRDIFDGWFFMQRQTPVNTDIVESRMSDWTLKR